MQTPPCDAHTSCDARPAEFVGTYIGNPLAESLDARWAEVDEIFCNDWRQQLFWSAVTCHRFGRPRPVAAQWKLSYTKAAASSRRRIKR